MYIYKVAPKSKSKTKDSYDYMSELPIKLGTIVKIELGQTKIDGVVIGISKVSKFATKQILKLVSRGPAFTPNQFILAEIIQDEYLTALGETIFSFLPTMNVSDVKKIGTETSVSKKRNQKDELFIASHSNRFSFYIELSSKAEGQTLIVLPSIEQIDKIYGNLKKILPNKKIYRYYSSIRSEQKRMIWTDILKGSNAIILSTRQGLLLPFTNLALLCLDDPLNFAYQEDQVPYYQAFFVARKLRDVSGCKLVIGESIPDLNSFAAYKSNKISMRSVKSNLEVSAAAPFFKFDQNINLLKAIKHALKQKGRVCFIGPWKNQVRLICGDCKGDIYCPGCKGEHFDQNSLSCIKCSSGMFHCPNCKSPKIKPSGYSYRSIEQKIVEALPEYQDEITKNPNHFKDHLITIAPPNEIADSSIDYEIAVFPYFDKMADFASLGYRHKVFRFIYDLPRLSITKVFLCGEELGENKFANQIINFNFEDFLLQELKTRKQIKLPPFAKAVEVVIKTTNRKSAELLFEKISKKTGIPIIPLKYIARSKYIRMRGLFFAENSKWPNVKKSIESLNLRNCHFEIDRGEYL